MSNTVWIISGRVAKADAASFYKADARVVHLVCPSFPTSEQAQAALLQGWSRVPHKAEVRSIPLVVKDLHGGNEQLVVTLLDALGPK